MPKRLSAVVFLVVAGVSVPVSAQNRDLKAEVIDIGSSLRVERRGSVRPAIHELFHQ
jgi:hypothetical protein